MVCKNCKHPYTPKKASSKCFDCAQNPNQLLLKKHTGARFEHKQYASGEKKEPSFLEKWEPIIKAQGDEMLAKRGREKKLPLIGALNGLCEGCQRMGSCAIVCMSDQGQLIPLVKVAECSVYLKGE